MLRLLIFRVNAPFVAAAVCETPRGTESPGATNRSDPYPWSFAGVNYERLGVALEASSSVP
jgi:hypothetical protein